MGLIITKYRNKQRFRKELEQTDGICLKPVDINQEPIESFQEILRIVDPLHRNQNTDLERILEEYKALHEFKKTKDSKCRICEY
jgi:hypothetical protein